MPTDHGLIAKDMDKQIAATHQRFQQAMAARLKTMRLESKERYFAVLCALVTKLEDPSKPLRQVLQEVLMEAAPYIAQEIGEQS
jgi:hypothetical protein